MYGLGGTVSAVKDLRLSNLRPADGPGDGDFPILDKRCWSYASDECLTLLREQSRSPVNLGQHKFFN